MIKRKEFGFHLLFWVLVIGNVAINSNWSHDFPDRGVFLIVGGLVAPAYFNAFFLIPRYFSRSEWPDYLFCLTLLLLIVLVFKSIHFMISFIYTATPTDYLLNGDFIQEFLYDLRSWVLGDFQRFDIFLNSPTAWIVYLSFGYQMGQDWFTHQQVKPGSGSSQTDQDFFFVNSGTERHKIFLDDIRYLEGNGNYVTYHLRNMKVLVRTTIKQALAKLPAQRFIQIHRSYVVSIDHIDKIRSSHVDVRQTRIAIGPKYKSGFKKIISGLNY